MPKISYTCTNDCMCFCALLFIEHFPALLNAIQPERNAVCYALIRSVSVVKRFECFRAVFAFVVYLDPVFIAYFGQRETHSRCRIDCVHYDVTHGVFLLISAAGFPLPLGLCGLCGAYHGCHTVLTPRVNRFSVPVLGYFLAYPQPLNLTVFVNGRYHAGAAGGDCD